MPEILEKKSIKNIDFNCDLAQAYGVYKNIQEYELLDYVSSVNISCGFHAGDPVTIKEAMLKAKEKNVAIGAHIGFNDIQGFGYRPVELKEDELEALCIKWLVKILRSQLQSQERLKNVPNGLYTTLRSEILLQKSVTM